MPEIHKATNLDRATADAVARHYRLDGAKVEIIDGPQAGRFTVIATYP